MSSRHGARHTGERDPRHDPVRLRVDAPEGVVDGARHPDGTVGCRDCVRAAADRDRLDDSVRPWVDPRNGVAEERRHPDGATAGRDPLRDERQADPRSDPVRARVEDLRSDTISIQVTGAPDSIAVAGDSVVTVAADADVSPRIAVALIDLTTDSAEATPLTDKPVTFLLVDPQPGTTSAQGIFLTVSDSVPGSDPHSVTVTTDSDANAFVVARRTTGSTQPDSAVVHAIAVTAVGDTVAGSPVSFIIVFESGP